MKKFRIIFVCRHNIFRSRVAEAYFKQINKNRNLEVSSGGLIKGEKNSKNQLKALDQEKIKFVSKPKNISTKLLRKQDMTIIVADDIPKMIFNNKDYNKKVIVWGIKDVLDNDFEKSIKTIKLIKNKVQQLIRELK